MTTLNEFITLIMAELPDKSKVSFDLVVTPTNVKKNGVTTKELNVISNWQGGNRIKFSLVKGAKI